MSRMQLRSASMTRAVAGREHAQHLNAAELDDLAVTQ